MPSQPPRLMGKLHGVPELPPHYLSRVADIFGLKRKLLTGDYGAGFAHPRNRGRQIEILVQGALRPSWCQASE